MMQKSLTNGVVFIPKQHLYQSVKQTPLFPIGVCFAMLLLISLTAFAKAPKTAIVGTRLNQEKAAKIEIYQQGEKFYDKIVWLKEPNENGKPKRDSKNPDPTKRGEPVPGLLILKNFVFQDNLTRNDGTIYDARNGKTYSCYLSLLKVRGYVGVSWLGQTNIRIKI